MTKAEAQKRIRAVEGWEQAALRSQGSAQPTWAKVWCYKNWVQLGLTPDIAIHDDGGNALAMTVAAVEASK